MTIEELVSHLRQNGCSQCSEAADRLKQVSALEARLAHLESSWPKGDTDVGFCMRERKCLELQKAEARLAEWTEHLQRYEAALREIISLMPPGEVNGRAYSDARDIAEEYITAALDSPATQETGE